MEESSWPTKPREQLPRRISTHRSWRGSSTFLEAQQIRPRQANRDVLHEDPSSDSLKDSQINCSVLIETGSGGEIKEV
eukprot:2097359-Ditylum_brightwellii.AAC.1